MEKLHRIKKYREESMFRTLQDMCDRLAAAEALVEEKNRELEEYRQWRCEKEQELFADVSGQAVSLSELNHYTGKAMELKTNELGIIHGRDQACENCHKAKEEEESARKKYFAARKASHKIEELNQVLMQEQRKLMERKAEIELDDIPARKNQTTMRLNAI